MGRVTRSALLRLARRTQATWDDAIVSRIGPPLALAWALFVAYVALPLLGLYQPAREFAGDVLRGLFLADVFWFVLRTIDVFGQLVARSPWAAEHPASRTLVPLGARLGKAFVLAIAVVALLAQLGYPVASMVAGLGIGGLALALAAQDTLANLFGAIAVLIDKPFQVGDFIKLEGVEGTVEAIGFRCTRVRSSDGHLVSIPNKTVGNATVTNVAKRPNIRTLLNIGITYDTPTEKVQRALAILDEVYRRHPRTHDVWISFNQFADCSLNIFVVHWWKTTVFKGYLDKEHLAGMQELNLTVKKRFDEEGISFAFPTRTLYVKQDSDWRVSGDGARARVT
jgi:MscS family membrane protein